MEFRYPPAQRASPLHTGGLGANPLRQAQRGNTERIKKPPEDCSGGLKTVDEENYLRSVIFMVLAKLPALTV